MPRKSFTINGNNLPKTQWVGGSVGGFVWRCGAVMHVTEKEETIEGNLLNGCAACSGQSVGFFGDWAVGIGDWRTSKRVRKKSKQKGTQKPGM